MIDTWSPVACRHAINTSCTVYVIKKNVYNKLITKIMSFIESNRRFFRIQLLT